MNDVFIVWRAYQGRVDAMRRAFEYSPYYLGWSFRHRIFRIFEYVLKSGVTLYVLWKRRPHTAWVQLPPTFLIHLLAIYKTINPEMRIIADCHNAAFRSPWVKVPGLPRFLNKYADVVLVHNGHVFEELRKSGIDISNYCVLETRPAEPVVELEENKFSFPRPWVLFAASFSDDEPFELIFQAAGMLPEVTFVVTGNTDRAQGRHNLSDAPDNIRFTGWVTTRHYKGLLASADLIVGLTRLEGVQLSVANEATGFGKAMVLSDTRVLRALFPKGAVFVREDPESLKQGIRKAIHRKAELEVESKQLRRQRIERWSSQAEIVKEKLTKDKRRPECIKEGR